VHNPHLLSSASGAPAASPTTDRRSQEQQTTAALPLFVEAVKSGKQYPGNFVEAEYITEAVNLYAAALRSRKMLKYDAASLTITNVPEANKYLSREYRSGWDPATI
jgi:hypothetical protein